MTAELYRPGFDHAKKLVEAGEVVLDERDDWSEHQPTAAQENDFIDSRGMTEYARWHLGVDPSHGEEAKARYKFPYGDFTAVHRCGVIAAEVRAAQEDYTDIQVAAAHLHGMLDARR
jgi:hypothetical protein